MYKDVFIKAKNIRVEDDIVKDVRNCFRLKLETNDTTIKAIRNLFTLKN